jgi:hypothetical protein
MAIVDAHAHGVFKDVASAMPQISPAPCVTKSSCALVKLSWRAEASEAFRALSDGSRRRIDGPARS